MSHYDTTGEPTQWTYVYWDQRSYKVMRQSSDPAWGRVISNEVTRGHLSIAWEDMPRFGDLGAYAAKQIELGLPHATEEYPLRTCEGKFVEKSLVVVG